MSPYLFYYRNAGQHPDDINIRQLEQQGVHIFRLSEKVMGAFPIRLIGEEDYNRYREAVGLPAFTAGQVVFSRTLAARFDVGEGDTLRIETPDTTYDFLVIEISDAAGTFPEQSSYIDLKSFALFSDGNPLFRDNLELTLGNFVQARSEGTKKQSQGSEEYYDLQPYYGFKKSGRELQSWQLNEIENDFLIFDFILFMTVILTFIGTVNTLLIRFMLAVESSLFLKRSGLTGARCFVCFWLKAWLSALLEHYLQCFWGLYWGWSVFPSWTVSPYLSMNMSGRQRKPCLL